MSVYVVIEFPALGYLYNNVYNDVTCVTLFAGMHVVKQPFLGGKTDGASIGHAKNGRSQTKKTILARKL